MDGIFNINKPAGKTSYSIVAMVKRLTCEKKVGHAGTLDPMATGVLPVFIGQATRMVEYLMDATKTYLAEIELGVTTSTYDAEGEIIGHCDVSRITSDDVVKALNSFRGLIQQTPPMYSALKHHGKPLYELARAGVIVERRPRAAMIHSIELKSWQMPIATVEVVCGKGTYIRSIANDLGQMLGCGASLKSLVRTQYGIFNYADAITPDQLREATDGGYWASLLYPVDSILAGWEAIVAGEELEKSIRDGKLIALAAPLEDTGKNYSRVYTNCGELLAILRFDSEKQMWQPEKVFNSQRCHANCACEAQKHCPA